MQKTLLFVFTICFSASILSAQVFPLDAFGASAAWGRPAFVDGEWVSILSASSGSFLVEGDTARFISTDHLDRVLYDGDRVVVLDDGRDQFLPTPMNVGQLTDDRRAIETEFFPTVGGLDLSMLDVVISETSSLPIYLTADVVSPSGFDPYSVATYFVNGYSGEIGRLRGVPYLSFGEYASYPIGVGEKGQNAVFISRIVSQDKNLPIAERVYAYGIQVVNETNGVSVDRYTELRGQPIAFLALDVGYALVTTSDILFLNEAGEELGVVLLPQGFDPISACANDQANGVYLLNNLDYQVGFQTLLEVDNLGLIRSQHQTFSNQTVLEGIYRSTQNGLRVQGAEVGTPFWLEGDTVSEIAVFDQVAQSLSDLRYDVYPYRDTVGRKMVFGAEESFSGDSTYLDGVYFTSLGNVLVDYGEQKELRSPSGQYMGEPNSNISIDSSLVNLAFQNRLSVSTSATVLLKEETSSGLQAILWTVSPGRVLSNPLALPFGLVLVTESESSPSSTPSRRHHILDTLGNLQTTLRYGDLEPYPFEQGLVLSGSSFTTTFGLFPNTIEGYYIYPYELLKKPSAITGPLLRCSEKEYLTFYDEFFGEDRTVSYNQNSTFISIEGVRFPIDVDNQLSASIAIVGYDVNVPCEGGNGSLEVLLAFPQAIDSVFISGQLANPLVFSGSVNHQIRLVDTLGCVADTSVSIEGHRFLISVSGTCYGDELGRIRIPGADSVWIDSEYSEENEFSNLAPGDYLIEANAIDGACRVDTVLTVIEADSIGLVIDQLAFGDSVLISVNPPDMSLEYVYRWNTNRPTDRNTFIALAGDTVLVRTFSRGCSRYDTIYTQGVVNTYSLFGNTINIYPNPARSQLTLETSSTTITRIVNAYGRVISEWQVPAGRSIYSIAQYPTGMYTIVVGPDGNAPPIRIMKIE